MRWKLALAMALLFACASHEGALPHGDVIDLSWAYDSETIFWPTERGFEMEWGPSGYTEGGYFYAAHRFSTAEHGGTHLDAPIHFAADQQTVDEIPLDRLLGEGVVIDVSGACRADRDHRITTAELAAWERAYGRIPSGAIVLLRTGFGAYWPDRERYLATDARGAEAASALHFPGLHEEAARWLAGARRIRAVGIDTASIDHGPSRAFKTHRVLSAANVPIFENLARLDRLPARGFSIVALPMKIRGGSGAPLRIIAILP